MEGLFFSADFYTAFVFFEVMSLTSYVGVAQEETEEALRAAATYLAIAVTGGLVTVSYTHLDVYKRQEKGNPRGQSGHRRQSGEPEGRGDTGAGA